ncbi:MAG: 1-acyl-sn-glycerol-3-phosphate acyltransferase [Bdellovibrionales bacterium]|nr:1-acyl-sn-glycerol-3-phosphate acyltransferase [Bdellovibrionales bacterium]
MNYVKAVVLLLLLLFFGLIAVLIAVPAMITGKKWKWLNQAFLKPFGYAARGLVGVKLTTINLENITSRRPAVLLGTHQSGFDLAVIGSVCPTGSIVVGKKEIANIPLIGWWWKAAGNLFLDRSNPKNAKEALASTAKEVHDHGLNVAIFPEGTRNTGKTPGLLPFKKGGFHLAMTLGIPVIPVICSSMRHRAIWETFELNGGQVIISVLPAIDTMDWTDDNLVSKVTEIHRIMSAEFERISALAAGQEVR